MDATALLPLLAVCAPLVDTTTATALIAVESSSNPHAIGVVGGRLLRQPAHRAQALATARALAAQGWNFSVGLGQINVRNFGRLGLDLESAFDPCTNLRAMQAVLVECFGRTASSSMPDGAATQRRLRQALSCYYAGDFTTGFRDGYVRRVANATLQAQPIRENP
jgi:type IV secretion system protein VirB1